MLTTKPGQVSDIAIGGVGRPVIGKVILPDQQLRTARSGQHLLLLPDSKGAMPDNFYKMGMQQREAWLARRRASPEWAETIKGVNARTYPVRPNPDGTFRVEDVVSGDYLITLWVVDGPPDDDGNGFVFGGVLRFEVPTMAAERLEEPLDIGTFTPIRFRDKIAVEVNLRN